MAAAGGGSLAFHLKRHFHRTLTDLSAGIATAGFTASNSRDPWKRDVFIGVRQP